MEHFDSIADVLERLRADTPCNPLGSNPSRDQYEWIDWGDGDGGRIMPSLNSPFASPYLYRGQRKRHSPCFPTLYRGFEAVKNPQELPPQRRDAYLLAQVRVSEFLCLLEQHPAVGYAREIGLHLSRMALSQHYELATDHLDLTADPEVAAFFASCWRDGDGRWYPASDGEGVVYRFDLTAFPRALGDKFKADEFFRCVEMVGLQTLPRPGEQKAWTIRLPLGLDFERLPLDAFAFRHRDDLGGILLDQFEQGRSLFPRDVLAEAAKAIRVARSVPTSILRRVLVDHGCRPDMLDEAVAEYRHRFGDEFSVDVTDRETLALDAEQLAVAAGHVERQRSDFLHNVDVRPVKIRHVPTLIELLSDHRDWNRATSAKVLGDLGATARDALPALRGALQDTSEMVRTAAATAIRQIEECDHGPA
jgi:hypothetical protein